MVVHFAYNTERSDLDPRINNYESMYPVNKCQVNLKNAELWNKFYNLETEMIITKSGRRMFPSLQVQISELDPQALYCIFLEMVPASRCRFKYSTAGGWAPAGSEEAQSPHRIYLHPESPAKGEYWMSQPVSFGRLKLTNMPAPPAGQIVLSSMHKYQPRIIIAQTSDPRTITWCPSTYVAFPETQFIAVTAYQNEKITQLKIDNNPFAKGFRQNGQAKCKRKRICTEEKDEDLICVTDDPEELQEHINRTCLAENDSKGSSSIQELSPKSRVSSEEDKASACSSPLSAQGSPTIKCAKIEDFTDVSSVRNRSTPEAQVSTSTSFYPYPFSSELFLPTTPCYSYFSTPYMPTPYNTAYYYPYSGYYGNNMETIGHSLSTCSQKKVDRKPPRKLTDFSIKTLLGC